MRIADVVALVLARRIDLRNADPIVPNPKIIMSQIPGSGTRPSPPPSEPPVLPVDPLPIEPPPELPGILPNPAGLPALPPEEIGSGEDCGGGDDWGRGERAASPGAGAVEPRTINGASAGNDPASPARLRPLKKRFGTGTAEPAKRRGPAVEPPTNCVVTAKGCANKAVSAGSL